MPELFPYQEVGARFLADRKVALLADEMGLGKSAQAIRACDHVGARNVLVICPAIVRVKWGREFEKFQKMHRDVGVALDGKYESRLGVTVVSYDFATRHRDKLTHTRWNVVVVDECHFVKEPISKRTEALFGQEGIAAWAERLWCLSGTPAPNHHGELWVMLRAFGVFGGSYDDFLSRYCRGYETPYGFKVVGAKNVPELKRLLAPVMLRRKVEDVLPDLPPITWTETPLDPQVLSQEDLDTLIAHETGRTGDKIRKLLEQGGSFESEAKRHGTAIAQWRRAAGLLKMGAVAQYVLPYVKEEKEKIVLFSWHQGVTAWLASAFKDFGAFSLWGGTPPARRQLLVDRFQTDPRCQVAVLNLMAGGTGVELTAARRVVIVEPAWSPADNLQAVKRVHRLGQTRPVLAEFVCLGGSIDEAIARVLRRKTETLAQLFE